MGSEPRKSIKEILLQKKVIIAIVLLLFVGIGGMTAIANRPDFCTSCHNMQPYYKSWHEGDLLAKKHADANVSCHDCHEATMAQKMDEGIKQITGDYETPMEKRQYSNESCTKCHDMEKVKAKTVFDNKGVKVNPHDSHLGEQDCNTCHTMHEKSKLDCTRCHYGEKWMTTLPKYWR